MSRRRSFAFALGFVAAVIGLPLTGLAQTTGPLTALVGPGATDPSPHQLVRTSKNVLYAIAFDCATGYPGCGPNRVRVYGATTPGVAVAFKEYDVSHARTGGIQSVAAAIDGQDVIHVLWIETTAQGAVWYQTFNTTTNLWGPRQRLAVTYWNDSTATQGAEGVAIALDAAGIPHALWSARPSAGASLRIYYANRTGGRWSAPRLIDDQAVPSAPRFSEHPTMAFMASGDLLTAWIQGSCRVLRDSTCYTPDGVIYTRDRAAGGFWLQTVSIPDVTFPSIDNGPTLLVTPDGVRHISFTNAAPGHEDEIRYWYDKGNGWQGDQQPPDRVTHDPSLGPDGAGGLYIYGHGSPVGDYAGVGQNVYAFHKAAGSAVWSPWTLYVTGPYDDATSVRWSQFFHRFPSYVDATFWTNTTPYTLYVGTLPAAQTAASPH